MGLGQTSPMVQLLNPHTESQNHFLRILLRIYSNHLQHSFPGNPGNNSLVQELARAYSPFILSNLNYLSSGSFYDFGVVTEDLKSYHLQLLPMSTTCGCQSLRWLRHFQMPALLYGYRAPDGPDHWS